MFTDLARVHTDELARMIDEIQTRPRLDRPYEASRSGRLRRAVRAVLGVQPQPVAATSQGDVTIRTAAADDGPELAKLAELSERRLPQGDVLVAEIGSKLVAAVPLDGGPPLVDVLRPTADVIQLLELRSLQVRHAAELAAA